MSRHFRPWNIDQTLLLPPNVRDFVAQGPRLAVYRWAGAGEPGSQGDHGQLREWLGQPPFSQRPSDLQIVAATSDPRVGIAD